MNKLPFISIIGLLFVFGCKESTATTESPKVIEAELLSSETPSDGTFVDTTRVPDSLYVKPNETVITSKYTTKSGVIEPLIITSEEREEFSNLISGDDMPPVYYNPDLFSSQKNEVSNNRVDYYFNSPDYYDNFIDRGSYFYQNNYYEVDEYYNNYPILINPPLGSWSKPSPRPERPNKPRPDGNANRPDLETERPSAKPKPNPERPSENNSQRPSARPRPESAGSSENRSTASARPRPESVTPSGREDGAISVRPQPERQETQERERRQAEERRERERQETQERERRQAEERSTRERQSTQSSGSSDRQSSGRIRR